MLLFVPFIGHAATSTDLVGKWIHTKYPSMRIEIEENDTNFILVKLDENRTEKYAAKFSDGMLTANSGPCSLSADIEKKTGNLMFGGQEYRRLKNGESFEYVNKGLPSGW